MADLSPGPVPLAPLPANAGTAPSDAEAAQQTQSLIAGDQAFAAGIHHPSAPPAGEVGGDEPPPTAGYTAAPGGSGAPPAQPPQFSDTPGAGAPSPAKTLRDQQPAAEPVAAKPATPEKEPSVWGWLSDWVKGTGQEAGYGLMRGEAELGQGLARLGASSVDALATNLKDSLTDETSYLRLGQKAPPRVKGAENAEANFDKNVIQPAIQSWTPKRGSYIGDDGTGPLAQAIGGAAESVPLMVTGGLGLTSMMYNAFTDSYHEAVKDGQTGAQAALTATFDSAALGLNMRLLGKDWAGKAIPDVPAWIRRGLAGIAGGDLVNMGAAFAKKMALEAAGNDAAARKIDVTAPARDPIQAGENAMFGILGAKHPEKQAPGAEAPPDDAGNVPPPPKPSEPPPGAGVQPPAKASEAQPIAAVPDQPSGESAKQLHAQVMDTRRSNTPRNGVLITPESQQHLDSLPADHRDATPVRGYISQARDQGRTVQLPQGELVLKNKKIATQVKGQLGAGVDPQTVIGRVTGAGEGKEPGQTTVVQGREPVSGQVTSEKAVHPEDVGPAQQEMLDQGKVPVVMTPEGALQERAMGMRQEAEEAQEKPAQPAEPAPPPVEVPEKIAAPEPAGEAAPEPKEPETPQEGMFRTDSGKEVPVHLAGEGAAGKLKVRPLDENGEPQAPVEVPAERVRTGGKAPEATEAPVSETSKGMSAFDQLPAALASHERAETATGRRKNPASLRERQDNASAFAAVLRQAATEAAEKGSAPEPVVRRAAEASRRAIGLTNKSKEATEKGQGTGHAKVTALVKAMHEAARALLGHPAVTATKDPAREITKEVVKQLAQQQKEKPEELRTMARMLPMMKYKEEQPAEEPKIAEIARAVSKGSTRLTIADLNNKHEVPPRDFARVAAAVRAKMAEGKKEKAAELAKTEATPVEKGRTNVLAAKYLKAETPEEAAAARDLLTDHLKAVAARLGHPPDTTHAEVDTMLEYLRKQREQPEGEEPPETHTFERPEEGFSIVSRPGETAGRTERKFHADTEKMWDDMNNTGKRFALTDTWKRMRSALDTGLPLSTHEILDSMLRVAPPGLKLMLQRVRARSPDMPLYTQSAILNPSTGKEYGATVHGLYTGAKEPLKSSIQIRAAVNHTNGANLVWSVLHEAQHATLMQEYNSHPTGKLATELNHAYTTLLNRLTDKYGKDAIDTVVAHHNGESPAALPPDMQHLYGLKEPLEMAAELESNPDFREEVIESEKYKRADENLGPAPKMLPALFHHILKAISEFFGYPPELAAHIMDISDRLSKAQQANPRTAGMYDELSGHLNMVQAQSPNFQESLRKVGRQGAANFANQDMGKAAPATMEKERGDLLSEPKPIKATGEIRAVLGDEATGSARETAHALASRSIDLARHGVYALKTEGQIFRDGKDAFGHDDETNPINQERQVGWDKNKIMHQMRSIYNPPARAWMQLGSHDNMAVSKLIADSSLWGIDARNEERPIAGTKISPRQDEFYRRYDKLSDAAKAVYKGVFDASRAGRAMERRTVVDTALKGFDVDVSPEQKALLYGAKTKGAFERLIKEGGLVDVGDKNEKLRNALRDWVGNDIQGPYAHLARQGEYVVTAAPEGTREFGQNQDAARAFAETAKDMGPHAKADVQNRGGQWVVDYKVQHTSMHKSRYEAEQVQAKLKAAGFESPPVSQKVYDREQASALTPAMQELMTSAIHKIEKGGSDEGTRALVESLHSTYLQMQAARSAYAGSRVMRKGFGGVKAKDMRQNFAEHASSSTWHTASMATLFRQAEAMSRLRTMAKDPELDQATAYKRGEVVRELGKRAAREATVNRGGTTNRRMAQMGFMAYLTSPSHAAVWLTQNYSTGIPWAGARYGYGRAVAAFHRGMGHVASTALRQAVMEQFSKHAAPDEIQAAIERTIAKDPRLGKWAPAIHELYERGVISHGYSNELGALGQGQHPASIRVMDWARVFPAMADAFNRTSTALAGLELTGGDLRKTADMVEAIHADYSAQNKPRAFQALSRVPGGTSLTMFKTYTQAMAHMVYGSAVEAIKGVNPKGSPEQRAKSWVAAKTLAGVMVGNALFAGVYGALGLEPARLLVYAYNKIFGEEGEVWDMKNAIHHFLVDHLGKTAGDTLARGPIAQMLGIDVSNRMGLANLFFHDPPDLLTTDKDAWKQFIWGETPPPLQWVANSIMGMAGHIQNGEYMQAIASAMPVKIIQDSLKALQQVNGAGGNAPVSALDAFKQMMGFKPAAVADEQERHGAKVEVSKAQGLARQAIIKQYWTGDRGAALSRIASFNARNPGAGITLGDLNSAQSRQLKQEVEAPTKNVRANEAADFSGR